MQPRATAPRQRPVEFIRRNYYLGIINGALFNGFSSMVNPATVLSVFAMRLTESAAQVGLLNALTSIGWLWPQFLMANVLDPIPRKKRFYVYSALGRIITFSTLIPLTLYLATSLPRVCFWLMSAVFLVYSSIGGMGMIPFMDIVSKSVPETRRGSFWAYRNVFGAALGLVGGAYVKHVLASESGLVFPWNYLRLFQVALVVLAVSVTAFCLVREPIRQVQKRRIGWGMQWRRGLRIVRRDQDFRRLLAVRVFSTIAWMSGPFYTVHAVERLGAPESMVGVFIIVGVITGGAANLFWGRVSDRQGNRRVLVNSRVLAAAAPLVAVVSSRLPTSLVAVPFLGRLPLNLVCYLGTFVVAALALGGGMIGLMNYVLEIAPESRRPSYLGVQYTVTAPFMLAPWVGGALAKATSYQVVFLVSAGCALLALLEAVRLHEPREQLAEPGLQEPDTVPGDLIAGEQSHEAPHADGEEMPQSQREEGGR